jgi:hypothetical protein
VAQVIRQESARIERRGMRDAVDLHAPKTLSVRTCTR